MTKSTPDNVSLGLDFLAASRTMQRHFAAQIDKIRQEHFTLRPNETNRLSLKTHELEGLHAILECTHTQKQSEIADCAGINKPAFSRTVQSLKENGLVSISEKNITLTEKGEAAAKLFKSKFDDIVAQLATSKQAQNFAAIITKPAL